MVEQFLAGGGMAEGDRSSQQQRDRADPRREGHDEGEGEQQPRQDQQTDPEGENEAIARSGQSRQGEAVQHPHADATGPET